MGQVEAGEEIDVEQDLTPVEREKMLSQISGRRADVSVDGWRPWWEVSGDRATSGGAAGSPLITPLAPSSQGMDLPQ